MDRSLSHPSIQRLLSCANSPSASKFEEACSDVRIRPSTCSFPSSLSSSPGCRLQPLKSSLTTGKIVRAAGHNSLWRRARMSPFTFVHHDLHLSNRWGDCPVCYTALLKKIRWCCILPAVAIHVIPANARGQNAMCKDGLRTLPTASKQWICLLSSWFARLASGRGRAFSMKCMVGFDRY